MVQKSDWRTQRLSSHTFLYMCHGQNIFIEWLPCLEILTLAIMIPVFDGDTTIPQWVHLMQLLTIRLLYIPLYLHVYPIKSPCSTDHPTFRPWHMSLIHRSAELAATKRSRSVRSISALWQWGVPPCHGHKPKGKFWSTIKVWLRIWSIWSYVQTNPHQHECH